MWISTFESLWKFQKTHRLRFTSVDLYWSRLKSLVWTVWVSVLLVYCRYCAAGASVYDARGTTQIDVSSWPNVSSSTTTLPSLRTRAIVAFRVSTTSSSSSRGDGGCWRIADVSRTSVMRQLRCAVITSPPGSHNSPQTSPRLYIR